MSSFFSKKFACTILVFVLIFSFCNQTVHLEGSTYEYTPFLETEPNNTTSAADLIDNGFFGQTVYQLQGTITESVTDLDYYKVNNILSGEITIVAEWKDSLADQSLEGDLSIRLLDSNGVFIAESTLSSSGTYQALHAFIPAGTFYIRIKTTSSDSKYVNAPYEALVDLSADCWIGQHPVPTGPTSGETLTEYTYSGSEFISDCGAPIQVRFDWGDGTQTEWSTSLQSTHSWSAPGEYLVKAQGSCSAHPFIVGPWSQPLTVTITAPDFELITASANDIHGTVSTGGIFTMGTSVSVTAYPAAGYRFYSWMEDAITVSRSNPYAFSLMSNRSLTAHFRTEIATARLTGSNRYETAVSVSQDGWPHSTDTVIIARGDFYADALAGVPLAYAMNAPILLTHTLTLPSVTKTEIQRLAPQEIIILGGTQAVSDAVLTELATIANVGQVRRIYGNSRYQTAALIAYQLAEESGPFDSVHMATGYNFPDALAAASYAAMQGEPILLTTPNSLPEATYLALTDLHIANICLVGGTSAISANQEVWLDTKYNVHRVFGSNRYTTAVELAKFHNIGAKEYMIATGTDFPDAITGAVLAAQKGTGILLVAGSASAPPTAVQDHLVSESVHTVTILGGAVAVSTAMENWF